MNASLSRDSSLYELALASDQPLTPLQVSPATLKSLIDSVLDVLVEYKIPATVWVKLPRNEAWHPQIKRCSDLASTTGSVYVFNLSREEGEEGATEGTASPLSPAEEGAKKPAEALLSDLSPQVMSGNGMDLVSDQGIMMGSGVSGTRIVSIPLGVESQLKREYFLVVLSEQLSGFMVAHRPRSVRVSKAESAAMKGAAAEEEGADRKQPLLALCSFDPPSIQQVLKGLKQAMEASYAQTTAQLVAPGTAPFAVNWEQLFQQCQTYQPDLWIFNQLAGKQIHRQEEVWHRAITYRKQAEAAEGLHLQNEELLNTLRHKDDFFSNVGQELRTPLTNMKTALTLLNSPQLKPAQRQRYMQVLTTECDRQSSLITSLLDLVQLSREVEQSTLQSISLSDVVPAVVSTYQPLAQEKGVMLAYTIPENLPPVSCLTNWLKQIVINLLHNGVKFTSKGGQVWVRAKQQGDYLQLEIRDTGIGIPASELPKIFDRFYRVRQPAGEELGGAGLGLTIVQQILLRCGGSISVKSKLGEGSTFNVLLPIYKQSSEGTGV